jgi:hypothetical protein
MGDESMEPLVVTFAPMGNWAIKVIPFTGVLTAGRLREKDKVCGPLLKGGAGDVETEPDVLPPPPPQARRIIKTEGDKRNFDSNFINPTQEPIEE